MAKLKSDNSRKSKVSTFKPSWHVGGSIIVKLLKDLQRSIALHKCMHMSKHSETIHKKAILKLLLSILNHDWIFIWLKKKKELIDYWFSFGRSITEIWKGKINSK